MYFKSELSEGLLGTCNALLQCGRQAECNFLARVLPPLDSDSITQPGENSSTIKKLCNGVACKVQNLLGRKGKQTSVLLRKMSSSFTFSVGPWKQDIYPKFGYVCYIVKKPKMRSFVTIGIFLEWVSIEYLRGNSSQKFTSLCCLCREKYRYF